MKAFAMFVLFVGAAACGEKVNATVNCETTAEPAVECTVKQTEGKSAVEVCWEFSAVCGNGAAVTAPKTCATVKDGGSAAAKITKEQLTGLDGCAGDQPPTAKVSNLSIKEAK